MPTAPLLSPRLVRLAARPATKEAAIREACQMLIAAGYIEPAYVWGTTLVQPIAA
jgi:phosphocarrier protein FPr